MYQNYQREYNFNESTKVFFGSIQPTAASLSVVETYQIPSFANFLMIIASNGGAGGGGGGASAAGSSSAGGGGGACSNVSMLVIPTLLLPKNLNIYVGSGGAGGTGQTVGGSVGIDGWRGSASGITFGQMTIPYTSLNANDALIMSDNNHPFGGSAGNGGSFGAGGTAPTVTTLSDNPAAGLGIFQFYVGTVGSGGVQSGVGNQAVYPGNSPFNCPGAGGGGSTSAGATRAGGNITGGGVFPTITQSAGNAGTYGFDFFGELGSGLWPLVATGGSGGSSGVALGLNGGDGAPGCGGGGGGGSTANGSTGGTGGNGGPGFLIITAW